MTTKFICNTLALSLCLNASCAAFSNPHPRIWGSVEYLNWWAEDSSVSVPLITQNNNPSAFGFINEPGTSIIFGAGSNKDKFDFGAISGARVIIGGWLDEAHQYGIEGSGFGLSRNKQTFTASSVNGNIPTINIPFFSTQSSSENVLVEKHPNTATVSNTFQPFGLELNALYNVPNKTRLPFILLIGFHYLNIDEKLRLNDAVYDIPSIPNSVLNVQDNFSTKNRFYGIQIGARTEIDYHNFNFDLTAEIAFGENCQKLSISGETNVDSKIVIQPIGLFAEPSNIGTFNRNQFAIVPQLEAKISYDLNKNMRPFLTYNFIYINHIIRPGNQIDRNINQSQNVLIGGSGVLTGPASPAPKFNNTSMWMQGLGIGIEFG